MPHEETVHLWDRVLEVIRQEVNEQTYNTWFAQTDFLGFDQNCLSLQGPNQFFVDWLIEHHMDTLQTAARTVLGPKTLLSFSVNPSPSSVASFDPRPLPTERVTRQDPVPSRPTPQQLGLNPRYIFKNFVVGDNSHMAHAACLAVADNPAMAYNPLFLYGGVGLGKTHLMQAIGNHVILTNPEAVVHYVSAENFMNELIQSIRTGKTFEFKNRYRNVDLLLIDDIQFLAGKESTQQEFFHTFNALYDANKQIIVTSDRPPKEISSLEERLRSRFNWGLITDLQAPNFETRMAILNKKVEKEDILIPNDVLTLIAESITSNIRELEGALIRLLAFASLTGSEISVPVAKEVLGTFINKRQNRKDVGILDIIKIVSNYYSVSFDLLRSKIRTKPVAHARQVAMYICRERNKVSLNQIGMKFGGRDHTTVHHGWQKVGKLLETDLEFQQEYSEILRLIEDQNS